MKFFDDYVFEYDMTDPDINYKYYHCYRVMEVMELLAVKLNLSETDIHLAKVIGLLHDIGRFEQDKRYNSFKDGKFDHGDYAVEVLKDKQFLKYTGIDKADYEVVYKAIQNHNKIAIQDNLNERELFFSKMIRDADKIDILYVLGSEKFDRLNQDNSEVSPIIEENFYKEQIGNIKEVKTTNDNLVITFSYMYDINFEETYQIIKENRYYDKLYERLNRKDIFIKYLDYANEYIEKRSKKHVR